MFWNPVLLIRDIYPGSEFFHPGSRVKKVPDPGSRIRIHIKEVFLTKKLFLSSLKYDPECSSRIQIRILIFYPSWIPDPGVKKAPDPGSGTAVLLELHRFHRGSQIFWKQKIQTFSWMDFLYCWSMLQKLVEWDTDNCSSLFFVAIQCIYFSKFGLHFGFLISLNSEWKRKVLTSVGDPDELYVFGPSESGSGSLYHQAKKPWFLLFCDFFMTFYLRKWCKCTIKK